MRITQEQFITLETAELAKQAGFDLEIRDFFSFYAGTNKYEMVGTDSTENHNEPVYVTYPAPTQAVLQRWLREVKNIIVVVDYYYDDEEENITNGKYGFIIYHKDEMLDANLYPTYEAALEAGLQKCLTLILEQK